VGSARQEGARSSAAVPEVGGEMESDVSAAKRWKLAWWKWNGGNEGWFISDFVNLDSALVVEVGTVVKTRHGDRVTVVEVSPENGVLRVATRPLDEQE
jgi:hypothetical protein